ncbi:OLC1v1014853C1 [Oldenlandia corymbosa var. corymbosa]|uniref:OLC1v1014853C1 n=1 Tax=Oldenlandia corymbosa var. corymbosa TaxID=529605 RepID=A0AAV1E2B3_OLDCO|nr:OLC1v1014853C1 [Oldenlandia corymbosa var. corymbosa]
MCFRVIMPVDPVKTLNTKRLGKRKRCLPEFPMTTTSWRLRERQSTKASRSERHSASSESVIPGKFFDSACIKEPAGDSIKTPPPAQSHETEVAPSKNTFENPSGGGTIKVKDTRAAAFLSGLLDDLAKSAIVRLAHKTAAQVVEVL